MRSRYTAYTRNDQAYVSRSWYAATRPEQADETRATAGQLTWLGLEVRSCHAGGVEDSAGTVEFVAHYRADGVPGAMHEVSRFIKENGIWFYVDGQFVAQPEAAVVPAKTGRNDACFCGSGKKYKKCCGN